MIVELRISNLGVIADAQIVWGPGLTAVTGETGAGKTMVLTALDLLMGGRADPALVRAGSSGASVEGLVEVQDDAVAATIRETGADLDDGTVVILRTVTPAQSPGRSRAFLGGRGVPQSVLGSIAQDLVTVHGQTDQLRLRGAGRQRSLVDEYAGADHLAVVAEHRALWSVRQSTAERLSELVDRAADRAREADLLRLGLADVERIAPVAGEDAELDRTIERLTHVADLGEAAAAARLMLAGEDEQEGASQRVQQAMRALERAAVHDHGLGDLGRRLAEIGYLVDDVVSELSGYLDDLDADPGALAAAHARRADLATLTRSYGADAAAVIDWATQAGLRLAELDQGDDQVRALRGELDDLDARLSDLRARITRRRQEAADDLSRTVTDELAGLAMQGARVQVQVEPTDPGPSGADLVQMLFAAHPDAPGLPVGKAASGGELSRVMLALEVALAARSVTAGDTFVFDEVDAGVGGRAASEVGRRLAQLARGSQVIVVTHLAQVAAFADHHVVVSRSDGAVHASDVRQVTGDERLAELARMLSGADSPTARAHAAELLDRSDVGA